MLPKGPEKDGQAEEFWVFSCWISLPWFRWSFIHFNNFYWVPVLGTWARLCTGVWATVGTGHPGWFSGVCQLGFLVAGLRIFCFPFISVFTSLHLSWKADRITDSRAVWHLVGLSHWATGESSEGGRWVRLGVWILLAVFPARIEGHSSF